MIAPLLNVPGQEEAREQLLRLWQTVEQLIRDGKVVVVVIVIVFVIVTVSVNRYQHHYIGAKGWRSWTLRSAPPGLHQHLRGGRSQASQCSSEISC